ncbi:nucleotide sugar dehydrogenase [Sphingobacterium bovistauri]|uniref:Nucleotide sugar dehydrogenase n=1 Tax=Sphingobacterium bovistauri TaxID=2781959 RepID=A0ABS7Z1M8_9SPHI|nr:nucleotide sugar dehydrogenase [Sphingobacterium bovistauri]MCA5004072.1 nucleotide sugar dehydrogenase [Sphingobacterium bovistauri]
MRKIAVIGQGYVGLPLAISFAYHYKVVGFDTDLDRVRELESGCDRTREANIEALNEVLSLGREANSSNGYTVTSHIDLIRDASIYIITVPTPIDEYNSPDLSYLISASSIIGQILKPNDLVVYESTVYPGCTEEDCIPILEQKSGLLFNKDFFVGYSPERINPGDRKNTLENVIKVTSGSNHQVAEDVDKLYKKIIKAGTYKASSIRVAEAAKVIENAQRDLNISFVNELALIFDRMGIDTEEVLDAASTKYNFLKYKPGLVGGHCISVDPYYLTYKASKLGYVPEVILSGRRVNNKMGTFVASKTIKLMLQKGINIKGANILILGFTFKENCPDIRNTSVINIYGELLEYGTNPVVCDPWVDKILAKTLYGLDVMEYNELVNNKYDAIIIAVAHDCFKNIAIETIKSNNSVIFDCKGIFDKNLTDARL